MSIPTSLHAARELIRVKASRNEFVTLVHEATNEDPWGPTGPQMENVCRVFPRGSLDIMEEIRLRLKHREKSWRSCYKSLLLLDYLARNVAESALPDICSVVPTLRVISQSFYYTGRKGVDHGLSVRERAKKLLDILSDGVALREERDKAALTHSKLTAGSSQCGGGGGGGYANRYQSYPPGYTGGGGGGGAPAAPTGSYDPYVPRRSPVTRTREEQERLDMELAARMQREEENRSGRTVAEAERMFHQRAHNSSAVSQAAHDADMELARRLQEEEEYRARRNSDTSDSAPTPESPKAEPAKPPPPDVFDDLFAPAPLPGPALASAAGQPEWATATTAPPSQMRAQDPTDPFDAFLNSCVQQQQQMPPMQQIPPMQQQQQQIPPMQQQQQQIPPMQQQQQQIPPMQQQQQQIPPMQQGQPTFFGAAQFQPAVAGGATWFGGTPQTQPMMMPDQQQQQFSGWSAGLPPPQFAVPPQSNQWGTVTQSSNFNSSSSAMHQVQPAQMPPGAVNQNSGPFSGFMSANTGFVGTGSTTEQPFANAFGGCSQNNKSLDALMAERRAAQ